jgi:hypothetical protein
MKNYPGRGKLWWPRITIDQKERECWKKAELTLSPAWKRARDSRKLSSREGRNVDGHQSTLTHDYPSSMSNHTLPKTGRLVKIAQF